MTYKPGEFIVEFPKGLTEKERLICFGREIDNRLEIEFPEPPQHARYQRRCGLKSFSPGRVVWAVNYTQKLASEL